MKGNEYYTYKHVSMGIEEKKMDEEQQEFLNLEEVYRSIIIIQ